MYLLHLNKQEYSVSILLKIIVCVHIVTIMVRHKVFIVLAYLYGIYVCKLCWADEWPTCLSKIIKYRAGRLSTINIVLTTDKYYRISLYN